MSTHTGTRRRSRKASAIIASTAVLGIAAGATLATWTITEYVSGAFATGHSSTDPDTGAATSIEGSLDGVSYSGHYSADKALTLKFKDKDSTSLGGNDTVAAPYVLRTTAGTSFTPTIRVNSEIGSGQKSNGLTYSVYTIKNLSDCTTGISAATAGASLIGSGELGTNLAGKFNLIPGSGGTVGTAQNLCVTVHVPDSAEQDTATNAMFKFVAQQS